MEFHSLEAHTWNALSPLLLVCDSGTTNNFCDADLRVRLGV